MKSLKYIGLIIGLSFIYTGCVFEQSKLSFSGFYIFFGFGVIVGTSDVCIRVLDWLFRGRP
ncbi:UNVERIFIED_CONTAM: hypothetical protein ABID98_001863 [Brevibacillus sp. OAP136]